MRVQLDPKPRILPARTTFCDLAERGAGGTGLKGTESQWNAWRFAGDPLEYMPDLTMLSWRI